MIAPVDYTINAPSPMDRMQQGMAFGQGMRANEQSMQLAASQEERAQAAFDQQQQLLAQQQEEAQRQQEAASKLQGDLAGLSSKVTDGTATFADFAQISLAHPDLAAQLKTVWDGQSEDRKKNDIAGLFRAGSAIKSGNPDLAIKMLEDYAVAAENSGQKMDAEMARATAGIIKADPSAGLTQIGMLLHGVDEDAAKRLFGEGNFDRFKVVGDQLVDLGGEGGPKPVDLGAPKGPDWRDATPEEAGKYGAQFGQLNTKTGEFKPMNPPSNGITITNPDGSTTQIGGPAGSGKPMTDSQANANLFATRMETADKTLADLDTQGTDFFASLASKAPGGNYLLTPKYQMFMQAKLDFLNAVLRKESGAVIGAEELAKGDQQYFPQPGDSPEVIAQKAENRKTAIKGVREASGKATTETAQPDASKPAEWQRKYMGSAP